MSLVRVACILDYTYTGLYRYGLCICLYRYVCINTNDSLKSGHLNIQPSWQLPATAIHDKYATITHNRPAFFRGFGRLMRHNPAHVIVNKDGSGAQGICQLYGLSGYKGQTSILESGDISWGSHPFLWVMVPCALLKLLCSVILLQPRSWKNCAGSSRTGFGQSFHQRQSVDNGL